MTYISVNVLGYHWFGLYIIQCRPIDTVAIKNKSQRKLNENMMILIHENTFENTFCKIAAGIVRPPVCQFPPISPRHFGHCRNYALSCNPYCKVSAVHPANVFAQRLISICIVSGTSPHSIQPIQFILPHWTYKNPVSLSGHRLYLNPVPLYAVWLAYVTLLIWTCP